LKVAVVSSPSLSRGGGGGGDEDGEADSELEGEDGGELDDDGEWEVEADSSEPDAGEAGGLRDPSSRGCWWHWGRVWRWYECAEPEQEETFESRDEVGGTGRRAGVVRSCNSTIGAAGSAGAGNGPLAHAASDS